MNEPLITDRLLSDVYIGIDILTYTFFEALG